MWANKNFMKLAVAYALCYGVFCIVGSAMSNVLSPFGFTPTDIAVLGGAGLCSGVVGALLMGWWLDYSRKYRMTHLSISVICVFAIVAFTTVLKLSEKGPNMSLMLTVIIVVSIACVSCFPTCLSYGAELTFPLSPVLINACMNFLGQIYGFILMGASALITDVNVENDILSPEALVERQH